eukprot:snap_masked-scaffold_4-processed-gene-19.39-mRNA-1 protein AED:1.00 eAED:1.00 QI:0/-1/0/0/-1/1/1/0/65
MELETPSQHRETEIFIEHICEIIKCLHGLSDRDTERRTRYFCRQLDQDCQNDTMFPCNIPAKKGF